MTHPWFRAPRRASPVAIVVTIVLAACSAAVPAQPSSARPTASPEATPTRSLASPSPDPAASARPVVRDGEEWIVFQSLADQFDPTADRDGVDHDDTIFLARPDGSGVHRLPPDDFVGSEIRPTWSPDGRRVAFIRARLPDDDGELWVIDADGTNATLAYDCSDECNSISDPDWSSDGTRVVFTRDAMAGAVDGPPRLFELWQYDVVSGTSAPVLSRTDAMSLEQARLSPDGRQAVYVRWRDLEGDATAALFVADLATGRERAITGWDLFAADPDWSTHGVIAFNSRDLRLFPDTAFAANLYTVLPDGTKLRQLTHHGEADIRATQPRWHSDGRSFLYTLVEPWVRDAYGDRHLALMDADGARDGRLPGDIVGTHPEPRPMPAG